MAIGAGELGLTALPGPLLASTPAALFALLFGMALLASLFGPSLTSLFSFELLSAEAALESSDGWMTM
ncbi:hypothetical protein HYQ46_007989 [Verticillium longisporum]|nr:hypothetical protein HYQ46_007989 [Verticillium longisporum]